MKPARSLFELSAAAVLGFWFFAAGSAFAVDASLQTADEVQRQWYEHTFNTLSAQQDADSRFAAALIAPLSADPGSDESLASATDQAYKLLGQSLAQDPEAAEILVHALMKCLRIKGCDLAQYSEQANKLASGNAMVLLPYLHAAVKADNTSEVASLLEHMAAASGYDSYLLETGERIVRALKKTDLPKHDLPSAAFNGDELNQETRRAMVLNQTVYIVLSNGVPTGYQALVDACTRDGLASQVQENCRSIALKMENSTSMLDAMLGVALLNRTATNEQDRLEAAERKRRLSWLSHSYSHYEADLLAEQDESLSEAERYHRELLASAGVLEAFYEQGGEIKGMQALLTAAGLPVEPPEDWQGNS